MIEFYEIIGNDAVECAARFGFEPDTAQRVFIMREEGTDIGAGVLQLDRGIVYLKHIFTDKPFIYYDFLARAMLDVFWDMPGINVRIKKDGLSAEKVKYFLRFGFEEYEGFLEILSDNINLSGTCKL